VIVTVGSFNELNCCTVGCFSASIGLLSKSHAPPLAKSRVPQFLLQMNNLINLSNCKQETRHPRLFLSDNDGSVVLPDHLGPAPQIDVIPRALFSVVHQHSACRYISSYSFLLCAALFYSTSFHPPYLAYFIKGAEDTSLLTTQLHLRRVL
jgi:hypothetical protein